MTMLPVPIASAAFVLAAGVAGLMGYAIQRGGTCTVAAIGEIFETGKATRLLALCEAALWVAGGLLIANALGALAMLPGGFALGGWTVAGGMLLGIGAWLNRACSFGSIARLGSGEWAYAMTPLGFFVGVWSAGALMSGIQPQRLDTLVPGSALPLWIAPLFAVYAFWRIVGIVRRPHAGASSHKSAQSAPSPLRGDGWGEGANSPDISNPLTLPSPPRGEESFGAGRRRFQARRDTSRLRRIAAHAWAPHEATILIGVGFVILLVSVGAWTYTDLIARLATGMDGDWLVPLLLFAALLFGAITGGWTAGRLSLAAPKPVDAGRCLGGGLLMGGGGALIPGGNDGLILMGMPFLWPYAWVAIGAMCVTIAAAFALEAAMRRR